MKIAIAIALACVGLVTPVLAHDTHEVVTPKFEQAISNIPGKRLVSLEVSYPPGAFSVPHRHAKSSFLYVYILSGAIESQLEGEPARIYRAGDSFFEPPGSHHIKGRNLSATEPAKLLAVFIVDADDKELTVPDR